MAELLFFHTKTHEGYMLTVEIQMSQCLHLEQIMYISQVKNRILLLRSYNEKVI